MRRGRGKRTGTEGYLSWSFFGREKGRLRDVRSRVGMGRVRSSWWGEEFIMDEIALKGSDHHNFVWVCVSFVSRSVSDSAECPNPISHNHHPNTFLAF